MPRIHRYRLFALVCLALCSGWSPARSAPTRRPAVKAARRAEVAPAPDPVASARAEREQLAARLAEVEGLQPAEATARWLSGQAWESQDPWIHIMAARTWLKLPPCAMSLDRAEFHAQEAITLADTPAVLRIAPADVARVHEDAAAVRSTVAWRRAELRRVQAERRAGERRIRRGRQEVIAGGALMLVSALGGGVALAGSSYRRRFGDIEASLRAEGLPTDLAALHRLDVQGGRMLAAGVTLAMIGASAGVPLLILGTRDLRLGRRQRERTASLRVQPAIGGLALVGRF